MKYSRSEICTFNREHTDLRRDSSDPHPLEGERVWRRPTILCRDNRRPPLGRDEDLTGKRNLRFPGTPNCEKAQAEVLLLKAPELEKEIWGLRTRQSRFRREQADYFCAAPFNFRAVPIRHRRQVVVNRTAGRRHRQGFLGLTCCPFLTP